MGSVEMHSRKSHIPQRRQYKTRQGSCIQGKSNKEEENAKNTKSQSHQ